MEDEGGGQANGGVKREKKESALYRTSSPRCYSGKS
jgi:hypothetical protein